MTTTLKPREEVSEFLVTAPDVVTAGRLVGLLGNFSETTFASKQRYGSTGCYPVYDVTIETWGKRLPRVKYNRLRYFALGALADMTTDESEIK